MSITTVKNGFAAWVKKATDPNNKKGALARVYPVYQRLQTQRFQTEGASEGSQWSALDPYYRQYKLKRYGGGEKRPTKKDPRTQWRTWPGNGTKMLIGTGTLAGAVIGPSSQNPFDKSGINAHQVLFTDNSMTIVINTSGSNAEGKPFNYGGSVNEKRPFMTFSDRSIQEMKTELAKFIIGGSVK